MNVKVKTERKVDLKRLMKSGGDLWTIMLIGSLAGIEYVYNLSKLITFTSQETKKSAGKPEDEIKYFSYFTVLMDNGETLNIPINQGLYETYFDEYCDEKGNILDDHNCAGLSIAFTVKTFEDEKGVTVKDGKYAKKEVSAIVYTK